LEENIMRSSRGLIANVAEEATVAVTVKNTDPSRAWFGTLDTPQQYGFTGTPEEVAQKIVDGWIKDSPSRTCAVAYCTSADDTPRCYVVFEDVKPMRVSAVHKAYPDVPFVMDKGLKKQAEEFISRSGQWTVSGEDVICVVNHGTISSRQGERTDLEEIKALIEQGLTPSEIIRLNVNYITKQSHIRRLYFNHRCDETPNLRENIVIWHVGESGSGKSYVHVEKKKELGDDKVYYSAEYHYGFDSYNGEPVLFLDEFKKVKYELLLRIFDVYKTEIGARYSNSKALWTETHLASVYPPEAAYENMVKKDSRDVDSYEQLRRRITKVIYHFKRDGEFLQYSVPIDKYTNYEDLKAAAEKHFAQKSDAAPSKPAAQRGSKPKPAAKPKPRAKSKVTKPAAKAPISRAKAS
jgi:hypothetical protein